MKTYTEILRIHKCYVVGITDMGFNHTIESTGAVHTDDLHLCVELSAGHKFMLMNEDRFYYDDDMFLVIERPL